MINYRKEKVEQLISEKLKNQQQNVMPSGEPGAMNMLSTYALGTEPQ